MAGTCTQLSHSQYLRWRKYLRPHVYPAGQVLFYRNHLPYGLFILGEGTVVLQSPYCSGHAQRIEAPSLLGLNALIAHQPSPVTAMTLTNCEAIFAEMTLLDEILREAPTLLPAEARHGLLDKPPLLEARGGKPWAD